MESEGIKHSFKYVLDMKSLRPKIYITTSFPFFGLQLQPAWQSCPMFCSVKQIGPVNIQHYFNEYLQPLGLASQNCQCLIQEAQAW